jgi:hypothetical protein
MGLVRPSTASLARLYLDSPPRIYQLIHRLWKPGLKRVRVL